MIKIGLECHIELNTKTKLFCGCKRTGEETPNTRTCPTCLGHPGSRPMLNKEALTKAIKLCLALKAEIAPHTIFARKNYFYPDLSKNFQITQYNEPIGKGGEIKLRGTTIKLERIHIEEDPAAIIHEENHTLIDYNRSGNPLVELVTTPTIKTPQQAREFMNKISSILSYLQIHDNTCILKADVNVSIKESEYTRVEIKNITGIKEIEKALIYEITRQKATINRGQEIQHETRGWNEAGKTTTSLRNKESEADYGYILEPDLSIFENTKEQIQQINIPELADQKTLRFIEEYNINEIDAEIITADPHLAQYFEQVTKEVNAQTSAKWIRRELLRVLNYANKEPKDNPIKTNHMIELLKQIEQKQITENTAQKIIEELMIKEFSPNNYIKENSLNQLNDKETLTTTCQKIINENPKAVQDYKNGEEKSIEYLIGQIMKETKGTAEPNNTKEILKQLINV